MGGKPTKDKPASGAPAPTAEGQTKEKKIERFVAEPATGVEALIGFAVASVFTLTYLIAPAWCLAAPLYLAMAPSSRVAWALMAPLVLSIALPSMAAPSLVQSYPLQCMVKFFQFEMRSEISAAELEAAAKAGRHFVVCAQPHGVISFVGICSAVVSPRAVLVGFPTAVASVILKVPFLKHVLGVFGLVDASKRSLLKALKKHSVVLYIGGIAELFLSSPACEALYLAERKGFIKLAMQGGVDVIPIYLFGNTTVLSVLAWEPLANLSRAAGVSVTYFWGRWGLPLPRPARLVYVRGAPLGLPQVAEPTPAQIDEWHAKYMSEVRRLFEENKGSQPDYANKELVIH